MIDLNLISLSVSADVRAAIAKIEFAPIKGALILNESSCLVGIVTDGDIRRGLLSGVSVDDSVQSVMCEDFYSMPCNSSPAEILLQLTELNLEFLPLLDEGGKVVDIATSKVTNEKRCSDVIVVVMAGGEGKRLRPLTDNCPKPMLAINEKPMLEIIIERCRDAGFHDFWLSVNYLKETIQDYFGDGSGLGVSIRYLEENEPLGTAGSLAFLPDEGASKLLVLNADILTRVDFPSLVRFHEEQGAEVSICAREEVTRIPYGVLNTAGLRLIGIEEKPEFVNMVSAGIYLINRSALKHVGAGGSMDMPDFIGRILEAEGNITVFPIYEYWIDVGRPETFAQANDEWFSRIR